VQWSNSAVQRAEENLLIPSLIGTR
jgi:hypothetical protein